MVLTFIDPRRIYFGGLAGFMLGSLKYSSDLKIFMLLDLIFNQGLADLHHSQRYLR